MTLNVLFSAEPSAWPEWWPHLQDAFTAEALDVDLATETARPEDVDYVIYAPSGGLQDFAPFTRTKAVMSLWAGVESIVGNATLTQPLTRMVDPGLTEGMVEWVVGHTLRHHLLMDTQLLHQDGNWRPVYPPLARDRSVTILGLGALGTPCAEALARLNFNVSGWSRTHKNVPGIRCLSGDEGWAEAISSAHIVILLLPSTPQTQNILDETALAQLPQGAVVINPGRGPLINDNAMLAALDSGQVAHATLDVFREEPLPPTHPYWAHPRVTVTPHVASATRPRTAARTLAENITRNEAGEPLLHMVDRSLGY